MGMELSFAAMRLSKTFGLLKLRLSHLSHFAWGRIIILYCRLTRSREEREVIASIPDA